MAVDSNSGSLQGKLTIAQAAELLGVHKNTVRNRIKDGTYQAEKVLTERGETYFIEREQLLEAHGNNLNTNTLSSASQQGSLPTSVEVVRELLRPFIEELGTVREELGAERARREIAENLATALEAELEALRGSQTRTEASERADAAPAPDGPQEAAEAPQKPPEPVAQASSVGPSVGETSAPPEPEEAEQEQAAEQPDVERQREAEVTAPLHVFDRAEDAQTVEHERIVSREPTPPRGPTFANAAPPRRSLWQRLLGR